MGIDEAENELGVKQSDPKETIRRAYLKLLKTRKPEVDPEGFQRLRAAYELLTTVPDFLQGFVVLNTREPQRTSEAESVPESVPESGSESVPESGSESESVSETPRVEEIEHAHVEHPLIVLERADAAREAGKAEEARDLALQAIALTRADHGPLLMAPARMCEFILLMIEQGHFAAARPLIASMIEWEKERVYDLRFFADAHSRATWMLTRELGLLPPSFPAPVAKAIVMGIIKHNFQITREAFKTFRLHKMYGIEDALALIVARAPNIDRAVAFRWQPDDETGSHLQPPRSGRGFGGIGIGLTLLLFVGRLVMMCSTSSSHQTLPRYSTNTYSSPYASAEAPQARGYRGNPVLLDAVQNQLCTHATEAACIAGRDVQRQLMLGECAQAWTAYHFLQAELARPGSPEPNYRSTYEVMLTMQCGPMPNAPTPTDLDIANQSSIGLPPAEALPP